MGSTAMYAFGIFAILCLLTFSIYAISKVNPRSLRVSGSVWRVITFRMELGQCSENPDKAGNELN